MLGNELLAVMTLGVPAHWTLDLAPAEIPPEPRAPAGSVILAPRATACPLSYFHTPRPPSNTAAQPHPGLRTRDL